MQEKIWRVVIPIFYNIDPSNICKQNGSFGKGFNVLKRRFKDNPKILQKWSDALFQSANLSGWNYNSTSSYARPEFLLVENIVKDALNKLKYNSSYHLVGLIGITRHIRNIENLLSEARFVGIWGMGGVGKTTLAKSIFQELRAQYDGFSYIGNVKEQLKNIGSNKLQRNCLAELLKDKEISVYDINSTFLKKRLGRKKILLILDDVDNSIIAKDLTKLIDWFGEESRIIITLRDMQVLKNADAFSTYHVPNLDFQNSLCLFSLNAFNQHEPYEGYMILSISVVKYCQGNPLALDVLGCLLKGRGKEQWESALKKLDKEPPQDIVDVLKLSFDGLDEDQQNLFLELAFLINESVVISSNLIGQLYDTSAEFDISVLTYKSFISYDHCSVVMHDLMKRMGLKIARDRLISYDKTPIQLWRHEDITDFFNRDKAIEAIRCMSLDVSMMKSITLRASIFKKIRNLIFLKIYKSDRGKPSMLNIRGVLDYLSEELRFLSWEECPLRYVPLRFCAENLMTLKMSNSNIRRLWKGNQHFPNLERINLSQSENLIALPDLSYAPKIESLILDGCVNYAQIHSSTLPAKLGHLTMDDCGPMQIKLGGSIKEGSLGLVIVFGYLDLRKLSLQKVTMKVFVCGNMICGVRFKHAAMPLEETEELRKAALSLRSLLPFVREVEWFEDPIEFGHDFNQHFCFTYHDEERGDREEMMNGHQVAVTMSLMEDDEEDDVLMEDCSSKSKSVTFTRVPNSITRWSLLKELTLKSLPVSHEYCREIKPQLDVTISFPDIIPTSPFPWLRTFISYDFEQRDFTYLNDVYVVCGWHPDSSNYKYALSVLFNRPGAGQYGLGAWIDKRKRVPVTLIL